MQNTPLPKPRKLPKQGRSRLLVNSIREACLQILKEEGSAAVTTQRIADVAGIDIKSLYQYFPNKDAVVAGIFADYVQLYGQRTKRLFEPFRDLSEKSLEQTLRKIIELEAENLYAMYEIDPVFFQSYGHHFDLHKHVDEVTQAMNNPSWQEWFPRFLEHHEQQLFNSDLQTLSFIARQTLEGNLKAALRENPTLLKEQSFRDELLRALLSYLIGSEKQPLQINSR